VPILTPKNTTRNFRVLPIFKQVMPSAAARLSTHRAMGLLKKLPRLFKFPLSEMSRSCMPGCRKDLLCSPCGEAEHRERVRLNDAGTLLRLLWRRCVCRLCMFCLVVQESLKPQGYLLLTIVHAEETTRLCGDFSRFIRITVKIQKRFVWSIELSA
jgi:hypothetical protein